MLCQAEEDPLFLYEEDTHPRAKSLIKVSANESLVAATLAEEFCRIVLSPIRGAPSTEKRSSLNLPQVIPETQLESELQPESEQQQSLVINPRNTLDVPFGC